MTVLVGMVPLFLGMVYCVYFPFQTRVNGTLFMMLCYAVPLIAYEVGVRRVHRNAATGLEWDNPGEADAGRVAIKLIGMATAVLAVVAFHTMFRVYTPAQLHDPLVALVQHLPTIVLMTAAYFWLIDRRMKNPRDGYWELGALVLGRNPAPDWAKLQDFALGWTIKGFFLPIMFTYLGGNVAFVQSQVHLLQETAADAVRYITRVALVAELTVVVVGYTLTVRLFDAHIRSANYFLMAWVITLICYYPLNKVVLGKVFAYKPNGGWTSVIDDYPRMKWIWMALILITFVTWLWAAAIYGLRWSNLTNRGIITEGPYRFTKHPSYVSKNAFFWLTAAPFLTALTTWHAITATAAMVVVNGIYYGRARMEEKHLSEDPDYVAYALRMNDESMFRGVVRYLPFLRYRAPGDRADGTSDQASATPA